MDGILKIGIISALFGAAVYFVTQATKKASEWVNKITLSVVDVGIPSVTGGQLRLPLTVRIKNDSPLMAPIQNVKVFLSVLRNGSYVPLGTANTGAFTLTSGTINQTVQSVIDVSKLNPLSAGGDKLATLTQVISNQNAALDVKAEVTVTIEGIDLPKQTQVTQLYLKQILAAVA